MKKSIIAAGAASVALAAMPVVGVFAYSGSTSGSSVDTLRLSISESCTFSAVRSTAAEQEDGADPDTDPWFINLGTVDAGSTTAEKVGGVMTISCNDEDGWTLKATATDLNNPITGTALYNIPFGAFDTTGNSVWSAKIAVANATTVDSEGTADDTKQTVITHGWDSYAGATASSTNILTSNKDSHGNVHPVSGMTVTPTYKAFVDSTQEIGTYEGTMTYTFATAEV